MNAARQACRPKQLSYLLYYASTRRSKLTKVTDFLDKRATSDVWKGRTGNVQVTLQIVTALIEKTPRDLSLYSRAVLRILKTVLEKRDVGMCEETMPVWEALCRHQEPASLAADREYSGLYEEIVNLYAGFARKEDANVARQAQSWPVQLRFRRRSRRWR
jgi:hypothetical protein